MPLIAGSLNFAWEINALLLSRGFYGHVLWTGLDVLIVFHNVRFLEKGKRKKYLLLIVVFILVLYGMFRIPNVDGQRISVFAIDLIMAIEYVLCAKQIAPQGRISVGVLKLLGDLFAWLSNMQSSLFVAVCGVIVLLLNLFYLAICLIAGRRCKDDVMASNEFTVSAANSRNYFQCILAVQDAAATPNEMVCRTDPFGIAYCYRRMQCESLCFSGKRRHRKHEPVWWCVFYAGSLLAGS